MNGSSSLNGGRWAGLIAQLDAELAAVSEVTTGSVELLASAPPGGDSVYTRAAGSILQDFYNGAERMWRHVASDIDGGLPSGPDWHVRLLNVMSLELEGLRPPVIGPELATQLHEYLGFQRRFRNLYGHQLEWERVRDLLLPLPELQQSLAGQVRRFEDFLRATGTP